MNRTKLTPFVKKKLCELVELGVPDCHAAVAVGITPQTYVDWKHRGENAMPGNGDIYLNLLNGIEESKAKFIEKNVRRIDSAADKDIDNARWLLERRDADNFAKREPTVIIESKVLLAIQQQAREDVKVLPPNEIDDTKQLGTVVEGEVVGGE